MKLGQELRLKSVLSGGGGGVGGAPSRQGSKGGSISSSCGGPASGPGGASLPWDQIECVFPNFPHQVRVMSEKEQPTPV